MRSSEVKVAGPQVRGVEDKAKSATKGAIRGLTADLVGGPVDLMQAIVNLGLAGGGFVGHKLGLLRTDQLPDPIEGAVGTSDWWVKNTPLEDDKTGAYTSGRVAANVLPALLSLAGMGGRASGPRTKGDKERGALYKDGDPEVNISHATYPSSLLRWGKDNELRPTELYHPSWALTRNEVNSRFGSVHVVPKPERLEPRLSPTVIRNRDFYTPRWRQAAGQRAPDAVESSTIFETPEARREFLQDVAIGRNFDRFGKAYAEGGTGSEGATFPTGRARDKTRESRGYPDLVNPATDAGVNFRRSLVDERGYISTQPLAQVLSPRFQSMRHYGESPEGAGLLIPSSRADEVTAVAGEVGAEGQKLLDAWLKAGGDPGVSNPFALSIKLLRTDRDTLSGPGLRLRQQAAELLQQARRIPSEYGEAKTFGPFALNASNLRGIITRGDDVDSLKYVYERQGIPVVDVGRYPSSRDVGRALADLQSFGGPRVGAAGLKPLPVLDAGHSLGPKPLKTPAPTSIDDKGLIDIDKWAASAKPSASLPPAPEGFVQSPHWKIPSYLPESVVALPEYQGLPPEAKKMFDAVYGVKSGGDFSKSLAQLQSDAKIWANSSPEVIKSLNLSDDDLQYYTTLPAIAAALAKGSAK